MTSPDEKEAVPSKDVLSTSSLSSKLSDNNMSSAASLDEQKKKEVEITPMMDLIAGGIAGTASVVIGHPFDTIKVRLQLSSGSGISAIGSMTPSSLYSGMLAPLSTAAMVNAIIFATFGWSSRSWDEHVPSAYSTSAPLKNFTCGSFAGLVQCTVICPMVSFLQLYITFSISEDLFLMVVFFKQFTFFFFKLFEGTFKMQTSDSKITKIICCSTVSDQSI